MRRYYTIVCSAFSTNINKSNYAPILNATAAKIAVQAIGRSPILINFLGWGLGGGRRDLELRHNLPRPPPNRRYDTKNTQTILMVSLLLCSDATEVALPKENTIWKSDFNRLTSRKGDFSHINASIDATEVALPKENTICKGDFNCLISRKGDFSHINASIDATEVALPTPLLLCSVFCLSALANNYSEYKSK